jgi:hypothetical protein
MNVCRAKDVGKKENIYSCALSYLYWYFNCEIITAKEKMIKSREGTISERTVSSIW